MVLVQQTAKEVPPIDVCGRRGGEWCKLLPSLRRDQTEPSVWSLVVVMADVDSEHALQMCPIPDEEPVETLRPHRPDPAFGVGVGARRPHGRTEHLDGLGAEDLIKGRRELAVAVTDEKPEAAFEIRPPEDKVSRLLAHPGGVGLRRAPRCTRRLPNSMKKST